MTRLVTFGGIGEKPGEKMLGQLVRELPGLTHTDIDWKASYGPVNPESNPLGASFDESLDDLYLQLAIDLAENDEDVVLAGYSGGAAGVGTFAAGGLPDHVRAVVLVSDPMDPAGGIARRRRIHGVPVIWVANPLDPICRIEADSPLRALAALTPAMALGDPAAWGEHVLVSLKDPAVRAEIAQWLGPRRGELPGAWFMRYRRAGAAVRRYGGIGCENAHTVYNWKVEHSGRTYLQNAAARVRNILAEDGP
ncbi:lysin B [Gordonia phage ObLaDi]|uniref:Lysin B n=2 Tax=Cafassovirus TaxID=3425056 RepID=A0AAE7SDR9_9CAUD|nr:lysin B [Gordonia phage Cafasso]UXE03756.1 lysin B [Gordonia phage ObLaDi]